MNYLSSTPKCSQVLGSTLHTAHCTLHTTHYTLHTSHAHATAPAPAPATVHFLLHTKHYTLYTTCLYCMLHIYHLALQTANRRLSWHSIITLQNEPQYMTCKKKVYIICWVFFNYVRKMGIGSLSKKNLNQNMGLFLEIIKFCLI